MMKKAFLSDVSISGFSFITNLKDIIEILACNSRVLPIFCSNTNMLFFMSYFVFK